MGGAEDEKTVENMGSGPGGRRNDRVLRTDAGICGYGIRCRMADCGK